MFKKITNTAAAHKVISGMLLLTVVLSSYFIFRGNGSVATKYALATVEKGTIVSSISGSGQVSVSNQLDIKPKVSGDVLYVAVKNGQEVGRGALIAQLDSSDAQKAVRDAEINLENVQISLAKLQLSQKSDAPKLQNSITNAQSNLTQAYQNGFSNTANAFLDMPDILTGVRGILYDSTVGTSGQSNTGAYQDLIDRDNATRLTVMINQATNDYLDSSTKYNKSLDDYKTVTRNSSPDQIINLINETLETAKTMSQTVKDEQNILDAVVLSLKQYQSKHPIPSAITQYQSDISGYIGKLNGHISSLANVQDSITSNQQALDNAQNTLQDTQTNNPFDMASQENSVKQKQAALQDARDNLANYYVRAPFAGVIAKVNVKQGDSASSGTAIATLITKQKIAQISLNEVDVAKVKVGQKVTLTFDAVTGLTITGEVSEIDSIGTVSQGVVTYNVTIGFDTQDERVKPGMSVSSAIITDVKQNALMIPNSAVKTSGGMSYVEVPQDSTGLSANISGVVLSVLPKQQTVELGISNDASIEVTSGLNEGDLIIVRTITASAAKAATGTSLFPTGGNRGTTGGAVRTGTGGR